MQTEQGLEDQQSRGTIYPPEDASQKVQKAWEEAILYLIRHGRFGSF